MFAFRDLSIQRKLTLILLCASAAALLLACTAFGSYEWIAFHDRMREELRTLAEVIGSNSASAVYFEDREAARDTLEALRAKNHVVGAWLLTNRGEVLAAYSQPGRTGAEASPRLSGEGDLFEDGHVVLWRSIRIKGDFVGTVCLKSDLSDMRARLVRYAGIVAVILLASLLVASLIAFRLQRLVSQPLLDLVDTARRVSDTKDYSIRASAKSQDEIGRLVKGFNEMLAQIQQRDVALRQSEELFRALIENALDVIALLEEDGTIRYASPSIQRLLGHEPSKLAGTDSFALLEPEDLAAAKEFLARVLASEQPEGPVELRWRSVDGSTRVIEAWAKSLLSSPAVGAVVVNARDMTDRRKAEEALRLSEERLRQSQKMEAIGLLAGGVAHDFNNLLMAIIGYSELLVLELEEDEPLKRRALEILKAANRAATLTRQLLAFSRKQLLQPRVFSLNTAVTEIDKLVRRLIGEDIELLVHLAPDLGSIKADPGQIEQVLMNLAINARDAMPGGGSLTIETSNASLDEAMAHERRTIPPGRYVRLAVTDTGIGMKPEVLSRLFEPFFTTKEQGRGTGLGLSTIYGIIKQSGGDITVYSEPGRGTTFKIYLPRTDESGTRPGETARPTEPAQRGRETVLLVEDEETVLALNREVLESAGYKVFVASNGEEALQLLETDSQRVDLMVTDVIMPRMGGPELVERLDSRHSKMRVLFVSGYTDKVEGLSHLLKDGRSFLQKPFTPRALVRHVRRVLDGSPAEV
jgi:PAS domain S-box-containing protein